MKSFITVTGKDAVGVVAKVATLCSEMNINILDVTQSILSGMFAMIMLVDMSGCNVSHREARKILPFFGKKWTWILTLHARKFSMPCTKFNI